MDKLALKGNIVLPDKVIPQGVALLEGERIARVFSYQSDVEKTGIEFIDYGDAFITPGFIDLHLHGALGKDVMDCHEESLKQIAVHQARCGVTGFLGSTVSSPLEWVVKAVETIKNAAHNVWPSEILGVYIEGPFLNKQKKGVHDSESIKKITHEDASRLAKAVQGLKTIISLAPEIDDNMSFISSLKESGMIVAIGHSNATYDQALESFRKGIRHATHLFNAMSGFDHREPGVVGAVLDSDDISAELIADGIHLHPAALRLAVARKCTDKLCLITDSLMAVGVGDGIYRWGNTDIEVKDDRATIKASHILAGSVLTLNRAVKNMIDWTGVSISQAVNMASLSPARVLGLEESIGSIRSGKLANLAVLDNKFRILDTILRGKFVLRGA
jgi:N-acetylglucosamine-6-phosphate deacetylase